MSIPTPRWSAPASIPSRYGSASPCWSWLSAHCEKIHDHVSSPKTASKFMGGFPAPAMVARSSSRSIVHVMRPAPFPAPDGFLGLHDDHLVSLQQGPHSAHIPRTGSSQDSARTPIIPLSSVDAAW